MKNNKKTFYIILIIAILVFILLLSTILNKIGQNNNDDGGDKVIDQEIGQFDDLSKEDKEKLEKYDTYMSSAYIDSLDVEKRKSLIDMIDEVIEAINTKNYTLLYSKLYDMYKESEFSTAEKFEEHLNALTYGATDYACTYYKGEFYGYECLLTSQSQGTIIEFLIEPNDEFSDYTFSPRKDIIEIRNRPVTFYVNGVSGIIDYEYKCKDTLEFVATIKNNTNKKISCSFGESTAMSNYRGTPNYYKLILPSENLNLSAGEEKKITFVFDVRATETIRPSYLNISCEIDGKIETNKIYIDPVEDDIIGL